MQQKKNAMTSSKDNFRPIPPEISPPHSALEGLFVHMCIIFSFQETVILFLNLPRIF